MLGREKAALISLQMPPGNYTASWNAFDASSGIYFYTLSAGEYNETRKMILIK
jgi:hypothetical protein